MEKRNNKLKRHEFPQGVINSTQRKGDSRWKEFALPMQKVADSLARVNIPYKKQTKLRNHYTGASGWLSQ